MILKNKSEDGPWTTDDRQQNAANSGRWSVVGGRILLAVMLLSIFNFATCKYGFKDSAPIPEEVKTFRVNYFENRADYKNPQLSPQITEKLKQKIISTTRLRQTNDDDAHYDISGYVSAYYTSSTGISNNNTSLNRLTATFHVIFKNTLDEKKNLEADVTYSIDFDANLSLTQVEQSKGDEISKNLTDAIFNKIFSNW
ncbi:MAG: LPS assembly lipoprotein LptE [Ferruginibacter sp.]